MRSEKKRQTEEDMYHDVSESRLRRYGFQVSIVLFAYFLLSFSRMSPVLSFSRILHRWSVGWSLVSRRRKRTKTKKMKKTKQLTPPCAASLWGSNEADLEVSGARKTGIGVKNNQLVKLGSFNGICLTKSTLTKHVDVCRSHDWWVSLWMNCWFFKVVVSSVYKTSCMPAIFVDPSRQVAALRC